MYWLDSCDEIQISNSSKQCMCGLLNYQYSFRLSREYKDQHGLELHASQVDARDKLKCSSREEVVTVDSVKRERESLSFESSASTIKNLLEITSSQSHLTITKKNTKGSVRIFISLDQRWRGGRKIRRRGDRELFRDMQIHYINFSVYLWVRKRQPQRVLCPWLWRVENNISNDDVTFEREN